MNNQVIKYIGYYDTSKNAEEGRNYSLAAANKMDYICNALSKSGYKVIIVSPSRTTLKKFFKGKKISVCDNTVLKLFPTFPWGNKLQKMISIVLGDIILFWYMVTKIERNEMILVYHSLALKSIVRFAKRIKGFKIILEVEEIYQDVVSCSEYTLKNEYKTFEIADKFIFPTELLNEKLNRTNKPYLIIHGTYMVEDNRRATFEGDKIHVVYAGTFDPSKGAPLSIATAEYLPQNYHVHIIGFGSREQIKVIQDTIKEVSKRSDATITYDGLLKGEEYISFLQKCHIGLSTQEPSATYNETSFPSKILSYMANGLRVVSVRLKAIEMSTIGKEVFYYKKQTPDSVAEAIMSIDINRPYNSRELIKELNDEFIINIKKMLEN